MTTPSWDATASFSWYLYQADVALLVALERIKKIYNDSSITDKLGELEKWSLEVEWEEDFTLIKTEERRAVEKHLYQVKEYEEPTRTRYLDWVIKLFKCTLENNNENIVCYTYICWKKQIKHYSSIQNSENLINSIINDTKEDLGEIKYQTLIPTDIISTKTKRKELYLSKIQKYNTEFEAKIKKDDQKFKKCFSIWRDEWFWDFVNLHKEIKALITFLNLKNWDMKKYPSFYKNQSDNYLKYFESKIKRMIQENKKIKIEDRVPLNLYGDVLEKILKEDKFSHTKEDYQDMFFNLFIKKLDEGFIQFISDTDYYDSMDNITNGMNSDEFDQLIYETRGIISSEKLSTSNIDYLYNVLKQITVSDDLNKIKNIDWFTNLNSYSNLITNINPISITRYIKLLINIIYIKNTWSYPIIKNFDNWFLNFNNTEFTWTLFGASVEDKIDFRKLLKENLYIFYENDYVALYKKRWKLNNLTWKFSWTDQDWINEDKTTREFQNRHSDGIINMKNTHIFCWKYYINDSWNICYMTEDCKTCTRNFND